MLANYWSVSKTTTEHNYCQDQDRKIPVTRPRPRSRRLRLLSRTSSGQNVQGGRFQLEQLRPKITLQLLDHECHLLFARSYMLRFGRVVEILYRAKKLCSSFNRSHKDNFSIRKFDHNNTRDDRGLFARTSRM